MYCKSTCKVDQIKIRIIIISMNIKSGDLAEFYKLLKLVTFDNEYNHENHN